MALDQRPTRNSVLRNVTPHDPFDMPPGRLRSFSRAAHFFFQVHPDGDNDMMSDTAAVLLALAASFGLPVVVLVAWKFWHDV